MSIYHSLPTLILLALLYACSPVKNHEKKQNYRVHTVAFYNLENLFDTIDNPNTLDEISPIMELKYRRSKVYQEKLNNMAKVLSQIGSDVTGTPPALIGVAEVENQQVLADLVKMPALKAADYRIIHFDSPDRRGIDVALLYQAKYFTPDYFKNRLLKLWDSKGRRIYTRDLLYVSGYLEGDLVHLMINHWPSRRGGVARSSPLRKRAALLNRRIIDSLFAVDASSKIMVMGDFNDDPKDESLQLLTNGIDDTAVKIKNPYADFFKKGRHTLVYRGRTHLFDQLLLSQPLYNIHTKGYYFYKASIFKPSYLTLHQGAYRSYPYRSFVGGKFTYGYSDHYPVYVHLIKKDKVK